jgi:hypothetical protein
MVRQHLRAETDAEEWLLLLERHAQPVDLATDAVRAAPQPEKPKAQPSVSGPMIPATAIMMGEGQVSRNGDSRPAGNLA